MGMPHKDKKEKLLHPGPTKANHCWKETKPNLHHSQLILTAPQRFQLQIKLDTAHAKRVGFTYCVYDKFPFQELVCP